MQDNKDYFDLDDLVVHIDYQTDEAYIIQVNGTRKYLSEF